MPKAIPFSATIDALCLVGAIALLLAMRQGLWETGDLYDNELPGRLTSLGVIEPDSKLGFVRLAGLPLLRPWPLPRC